MKIGSIVIRCYEFDKIRLFWEETLHYTSISERLRKIGRAAATLLHVRITSVIQRLSSECCCCLSCS